MIASISTDYTQSTNGLYGVRTLTYRYDASTFIYIKDDDDTPWYVQFLLPPRALVDLLYRFMGMFGFLIPARSIMPFKAKFWWRRKKNKSLCTILLNK